MISGSMRGRFALGEIFPTGGEVVVMLYGEIRARSWAWPMLFFGLILGPTVTYLNKIPIELKLVIFPILGVLGILGLVNFGIFILENYASKSSH